MTKRELFVKAHKLTKEIVKETGVNYRVQFGICLSFLYKNNGEKKATIDDELEKITGGSPKQIKWAKDLMRTFITNIRKSSIDKEIVERIIAAKLSLPARGLVDSSSREILLDEDIENNRFIKHAVKVLKERMSR